MSNSCIRDILGDAIFGTASDEDLSAAFPSLRAFSCPWRVAANRLVRGCSPQLLGDLHDLLLVDDLPVGVFEDRLKMGCEVSNLSFAVLAVDKLIDHAGVERTRAIKAIRADKSSRLEGFMSRAT